MITKTLVKQDDSMGFLPKYIGNNFLKYELLVFGILDKYCTEYSGGYWQFYELSNGGMFMSFDDDKQYAVCNPANYFDEKMSAEAVSIGVNLYALNALMSEPHPEKYIDLFYALREFACEHEESGKIMRFID